MPRGRGSRSSDRQYRDDRDPIRADCRTASANATDLTKRLAGSHRRLGQGITNRVGDSSIRARCALRL
jgi:hypothetical protein